MNYARFAIGHLATLHGKQFFFVGVLLPQCFLLERLEPEEPVCSLVRLDVVLEVWVGHHQAAQRRWNRQQQNNQAQKAG